MIPVNWKKAPDDTTVCYCNEVTLDEIKRAIKDGARSLEELQEATGACTGNACEDKNPSGGCCETDIRKILALYGLDGKKDGCDCGCCGD